MYSIFHPLDPNEKPRRGWRLGTVGPPIEEPLWRSFLALLMMPLLLVLVTVELSLQIPAVPAWIMVVGFCFAYAIFVLWLYRKT